MTFSEAMTSPLIHCVPAADTVLILMLIFVLMFWFSQCVLMPVQVPLGQCNMVFSMMLFVAVVWEELGLGQNCIVFSRSMVFDVFDCCWKCTVFSESMVVTCSWLLLKLYCLLKVDCIHCPCLNEKRSFALRSMMLMLRRQWNRCRKDRNSQSSIATDVAKPAAVTNR